MEISLARHRNPHCFDLDHDRQLPLLAGAHDFYAILHRSWSFREGGRSKHHLGCLLPDCRLGRMADGGSTGFRYLVSVSTMQTFRCVIRLGSAVTPRISRRLARS